MKSYFPLAIAALALAGAATQASALTISFSGQSRKVISITPEKTTGLDHIFVAYDSSEISEMTVSGTTGRLSAQRYSNLGGGYAEEIAVRQEGTTAYIDRPEGDMGYILQDGDRPTYIWIVNYLPKRMHLTSAQAYDEQECDNTRLTVAGSAEPIYYYSIDGRRLELSRDIELSYNTLEWSEDLENFQQVTAERTLQHIANPVTVTPPIYCNTEFTFSGDRFLEEWGMGETLVSALVHANGIDARTTATQTNLPDNSEENPSNIISSDSSGLGGSAPAEISFKAYVTDAVMHNEWQIADDQNFEYITNRINQQDFDYTFLDEGTCYVRYVGSNSDGTCEVFGDTYTVSIGASELRIPNAFSPNDDGINDEWKVSYRSLTKFDCTIFDRYGNQIFHFTDPNLGWDGKHRGKKVKAGVYYYVIEATGADGKKYKKGGDINIFDYKSRGTSTSTPTE